MTGRTAQILSKAESEEESESLAFLFPKTYLGAIKRAMRPGITAAMIVEEGCYLAEQKFRKTGLALGGAIAAEGLWGWQLRQEQRDRERGPGR